MLFLDVFQHIHPLAHDFFTGKGKAVSLFLKPFYGCVLASDNALVFRPQLDISFTGA